MKTSKIFTNLLLIPIFIFSLYSSPNALKFQKEDKSIKEKDEAIEKLEEEVKKLRELINIQHYRVNYERAVYKENRKKYLIDDKETLLDMHIKLFHSFGKIHGYVLFKSSQNDHGIIDNAKLKIVLFSDKGNDRKIFYYNISKDGFKELVLYRGDVIIAYPIDKIDYGERDMKKDSIVNVEAECLHLKASTGIKVN